MLIVWGSDRWLLAFAAVYLVYGTTLAHAIAISRVRTPTAADDLADAEREALKGDQQLREEEERAALEADRLAKERQAQAMKTATVTPGDGTTPPEDAVPPVPPVAPLPLALHAVAP